MIRGLFHRRTVPVALGLAVLATIALVALAGRHSGDARAASTGASVARAATASARALARAEPGRRTGSVQVSGSGRRTGAGTAASASTAGGKGNAVARAGARDVSLLDGYVTAHLVQVRAHASAGATALTGSVTRLVVNGKPKTVPPGGASFGFGGGAGRLIALERSGSGISGLHVTLDRAFAGKPAGYAATVGFATARASDAVAAAPKPKPSKPGATPGKPHKPARAKRRRAPRLKALATDRGYAFPVYGEHSFSDDWGAPRQDTGFHEGNDVFAKAGTPVVAVADGKLRKVGTAPVPGNRLWLDTKKGDQFFYGHLSAFAREARSGAQVKAGQVIGFVGSTGDAEQTPPHLHFEVHPGGGKAVDPYPFLRAWEGRRDVPAAAWLRRYAADAGSQPGTLVVVRDFIAR